MVTLETPLPNPWTLYRYNKNDFDALAKSTAGDTDRQLELYVKVGQITDVNGLLYLTRLWEVKIRTDGHDDPAVEDESSQTRNLNLHNYVLMRGDILPIWETPENENGGTLSLVTSAAGGWEIFRELLWAMVGQTLTEDPEHVNGLSISYLNSRRTGKQSYYMKIWDGQSGRDLDTWTGSLSQVGRQILGGIEMRYTCNTEKRHYNAQIMNTMVCLETGCYSKTRGSGQASRGRSHGRGRSRGRDRRY